MDRDEAIELLTAGLEGQAEWNRRRGQGEDIPDLEGAQLGGACLMGFLLSSANLVRADLSFADLSGSILTRADLFSANLGGATLRGTALSSANLHRANLNRADLSLANLNSANLRLADLSGAIMDATSLEATDVGGAVCLGTIFADLDLSQVIGLDSINHIGPSTVGVDTFFRSKGTVPDAFLRGCGVPDPLIVNQRSLFGALESIQFYSCFVSHSSRDQAFAERLHRDLQERGVRCWYAPKDLKIGEKIRVGIDESIRFHDKLLLVLSKNSVASEWVEQEVETAMAREREQKRTVLFPIRLDDAVFTIQAGWPALIKNSRNIGDFKKWKSHDSYQKALERLLRDLKSEQSTGVKGD
jgi:hypothetical protein